MHADQLATHLVMTRIGQMTLEQEFEKFTNALEPWSIDNMVDIVGAATMAVTEGTNEHVVTLQVANRTDTDKLTKKFNGESNLTLVKVRFVPHEDQIQANS